jgi:putative transposase
LVNFACNEFRLSQKAACKALNIRRSVFKYEPELKNDKAIIEQLTKLAEKYPIYGFRKFMALLKKKGFGWNHKKVYRIYCELGLNFRRKGKIRLPSRNPQPLKVPESINQSWSLDFMSNALIDGRRFRTFNAVDYYNREAFAIEINLNLRAKRVLRILEQAPCVRIVVASPDKNQINIKIKA